MDRKNNKSQNYSETTTDWVLGKMRHVKKKGYEEVTPLTFPTGFPICVKGQFLRRLAKVLAGAWDEDEDVCWIGDSEAEDIVRDLENDVDTAAAIVVRTGSNRASNVCVKSDILIYEIILDLFSKCDFLSFVLVG